jgi:hypothetical protein
LGSFLAPPPNTFSSSSSSSSSSRNIQKLLEYPRFPQRYECKRGYFCVCQLRLEEL